MLLVKDQRSPEWFAARRTRITASRFNEVLNGTPKAWSRLLSEIQGDRPGFRGNAATRWGERYESEAIAFFEFQEGLDVDTTGFHVMDEFPEDIGSSPDGLIGSEYAVEVKCPYNSDVHLKTWKEQKVPAKYVPQVQGHLLVTGRRFVWFLSYDPRQPIEKRLVKILVIRNNHYIDGLRTRLLQFVEFCKVTKDPSLYFGKKETTDIFDDSLPLLF